MLIAVQGSGFSFSLGLKDFGPAWGNTTFPMGKQGRHGPDCAFAQSGLGLCCLLVGYKALVEHTQSKARVWGPRLVIMFTI